MPSFILHDASGKAKNHVEVTHVSLLPTYDMEAGDSWIETPFPPWNYEVAFQAPGVFEVVPRALEEPAGLMLAVEKAARWVQARLYRNARMDGGCSTALGPVDTDADSRAKISGAVQMAMLAKAAGEPFEVVWTMADNSPQSHDADQMIQMGLAVGAHIQACQNAGTTVRALLEAAATIEDLKAVDVTAGYP